MNNLVSGTIEYTKTWIERVDEPPIDILKKRIDFLQRSERGGLNLSLTEIKYILKNIISISDELSSFAQQILDTLVNEIG